MAASSLGLNPEALFSSYSSPFLADYAQSFPSAAVDGADFSAKLHADYHRHCPAGYSQSQAPISAGSGDDDHSNKTMRCGSEEKIRARVNGRIGFRTRSEVEILDDGFKWRKYGKKAVKNSPNPRNYYKCSAEGCGVKKRVERDRDDPRYVVTTYDGVHNHATPGAAQSLQYYSYSPPRSAGGSPPAAYSAGSQPSYYSY